MTTPSPQIHIKSAARKLPIKRKTPSNSNSNPNPNPNHAVPKSEPPENGFDEDDEIEEEDEEGEEEQGFGDTPGAGGDGDLKPPPFKFHRIWSESDEIRLLQGLLGCWSQGMVFPRDLNLFYDRFSESMPQPYTLSQLSEKLRRLRKKFRTMSARAARGQDPSRLAPHDRDLLHLCTRLWHPSYASSSPFTPNAAETGGSNKRRRANPKTPVGRGAAGVSPSQLPLPSPLPALPAPPCDDEKPVDSRREFVKEETPAVIGAGAEKGVPKYLNPKTVMDVFDGSLKEVRMALVRRGLLYPDHNSRSGSGDLAKRWSEQRVAELDVLAGRLRLVLENAIRD